MASGGVHVRDLGPPSAPVVLALHGQFFDGSHWDPLVERLSGRFRILVPDLPAWGSSPPLEPHRAGAVLHALEELLVDRGVARLAVVGSSIGAYHALALALSGRIVVDRAVLLGGLAGLDAPARAAFAEYAAAARAGAALGEAYVGLAFSEAWRAAHPQACAELAAAMDRVPAAAVAADLQLVADLPDLRPRLPSLRSPVLVRVGALDRSTPPALAEELKALLPGARLEVVPGVGHPLLVEDPGPTLDSVIRFLG